jgi:acetyl esterase/lipase
VIAIIDQPFREVGGVELRFDLFRPDSEEVLPLIVCLHGGGWISGCKEDMREIAVSLANAGFAAATPTYRLAPLHPYPAAVEDVRAFVRFAREQASAWLIDADRIGSVGNSAGGHLSSMLGLSAEPLEQVNAVVDICGLADLTRPNEQHLPISWGFLEQFMGVPYDGNEALWQSASPLWQLRERLPPFYVIHGTEDDVVPVAQSDLFVAALKRLDNTVEYLRISGEDHNFSGGSFGTIERGYISFFREKLA